MNARAREALTIQPEALEQRRLQTRRYETSDEAALLAASLEALQDMGFELDESERSIGLLVASKNRDASSTLDWVGSAITSGVTDEEMVYDTEQRIRASVVTRPFGRHSTTVRVTFQRTVWDNRGQISRNESLDDPELYRDFFLKLSNSIFLTANPL
jgi:hypothetical protein